MGRKTSRRQKKQQPKQQEVATHEALQPLLREAAHHLRTKAFKQLEPVLRRATKLAPRDPNVLHLNGLYRLETKRIPEAFDFVSKAAELRPESMAIKHNLAAILIVLGRFEEAEKNLRAAIEGKPDYAEAYHSLAPIHKFKAEDPLLPQMEALAARSDLSAQDQSFIFFALAKAYDDIGLPDKAWPMMEKANAVMTSSYNGRNEAMGVDAARQVYSAEFFKTRAPMGHPTKAPIFVVGMPRSGTTLLESLISSHPQVFGAGELVGVVVIANKLSRDLNVPATPGFAQIAAKAGPSHLYAGAQGYLDFARKEATGWFDHFVDKLPDNSFSMGFIRCLLPNARFVHIMRHPLDTMLSIYLQRFTAVTYAFRLNEIAQHYRNYLVIMNHWRRIMGPQLIELRYENLIQDTEKAQDLLYRQLGLSTHLSHVPDLDRPVEQAQTTASRWQVRQGIYTTSREKWRRYADHIGPMVEALGGISAVEAEVAAQESRCALRAALRET